MLSAKAQSGVPKWLVWRLVKYKICLFENYYKKGAKRVHCVLETVILMS